MPADRDSDTQRDRDAQRRPPDKSVPDLVKLDRSSPIPLYYQVSQQLQAAIEGGVIAKGDQLGPETAFAEALGISRPTLRQAIQELVRKGLLVRRRGVGTEVVNTQVKRPMRLTSLYDDLIQAGQQPATQVLRHEQVGAELPVAEELGLAPDVTVVYLERLRFAQGAPLALMHNWLPLEVAGRFTTAQLESSGLYELLRVSGVNPGPHSSESGPRQLTEMKLSS